MNHNEHDVIIIGGGINGVGIARDCALRGIKAFLVEKHDFARGASGNNTGMIHGGIRYLRYDVGTTKKSCIDSGYIQRIAPHLLFRVPFLLPVLKADRFGKLLLEGAEIFFEAYDAYQPFKRGKKHTRLTREEALALEPGLSQDIIGAVTLDEWGIDAYRLTVANAIDAKNHGAQIRTYCTVTEFIREDANVTGVRLFNRVDHTDETHYAPLIINTTGGWGPRLTAKLGIPYKLRQSKGVHVVFSHRICNYGFLIFGVDGRQMFFLPHEKQTIIGTTDDDFYGDLDQPPIVEDEVKYILQAARHFFPAIDQYRKTHAYVGVRPTIYEWGKNEDSLSREHAIIDHSGDGIQNIYSVTGGKLAAYRQLAEEVTDLVAKRLGNKSACATHEKPLPGGAGQPDVAELASALNLPDLTVARAAYRHGSATTSVLAKQSREICLCEPVTESELRHAAKSELAVRLSDVCGRTRVGMGPCGGAHCLVGASQVMADECQWSPARQLVELVETMSERAYFRRPALEGANLAVEELHHYASNLTLNLPHYFELAKQSGEPMPVLAEPEPAGGAGG